MPAVAITTPFGETIHRDFAIYGLDIDVEKDVALFAIRDKEENVLFWKVLFPEYSDELRAYVFTLDITHDESEQIAKGSYKYGLTFYKDPQYKDDNPELYPIEGTVQVLIARKAFQVKEAVAREAGLW